MKRLYAAVLLLSFLCVPIFSQSPVTNSDLRTLAELEAVLQRVESLFAEEGGSVFAKATQASPEATPGRLSDESAITRKTNGVLEIVEAILACIYQIKVDVTQIVLCSPIPIIVSTTITTAGNYCLGTQRKDKSRTAAYKRFIVQLL